MFFLIFTIEENKVGNIIRKARVAFIWIGKTWRSGWITRNMKPKDLESKFKSVLFMIWIIFTFMKISYRRFFERVRGLVTTYQINFMKLNQENRRTKWQNKRGGLNCTRHFNKFADQSEDGSNRLKIRRQKKRNTSCGTEINNKEYGENRNGLTKDLGGSYNQKN